MTKELRDFLLQYEDAFRDQDPDLDYIFKQAHEELDPETVVELVNAIANSNYNNIDKVKRACVLQELLNQVTYALENPHVMQDDSNGWSRFDSMWMSLETYDLDSKEFLDFLIKNGHQYGLNLRQLDYPYGYWGDDSDWDLGWFDEKEFDKLYPAE